MICVHGTTVAFAEGDQWFAALLRGAPGAGKSDLALRVIEQGGRLVADDQTVLEVFDGGLRTSAPPALAGQIEVRGLGIVTYPCISDVPLVLVCDLSAPDDVPRMPEPETVILAETELPRLRVAPFEATAPIKLRLGVEAVRHGIVGRHP
jgi:HPr kinase/phosphorylase